MYNAVLQRYGPVVLDLFKRMLFSEYTDFVEYEIIDDQIYVLLKIKEPLKPVCHSWICYNEDVGLVVNYHPEHPALTKSNGVKHYKNRLGELHRVNGPAIVVDTLAISGWYFNDELVCVHRQMLIYCEQNGFDYTQFTEDDLHLFMLTL